MNLNPDELRGMSYPEAKQYIIQFISTLKLTEKEIAQKAEEAQKWKNRIELARSAVSPDLAAEAEQEYNRIEAEKANLVLEAESLKTQIDYMRRQLPTLEAGNRSIDPDLLEQELLIAAGYLPGDEKTAAINRQFAELEKNAAQDAALEALKQKIKQDTGKT